MDSDVCVSQPTEHILSNVETAFNAPNPIAEDFPEASAPQLLLSSTDSESLKATEQSQQSQQQQQQDDFDNAPAAAPVTPVTPVISKLEAFPSQPASLSPSSSQPALSYQERVALATQEQLTKVEGNDIQSRLLRQVEFYFSDTNLPRDKFLKHLLGIPVSGDSPKPSEAAPESPIIAPEDYKYVPLEILLGFNKIKALTEDIEVLRAAIKKSAGLIEMNTDETGVRRTIPLPDKPPKDKKKRRKNKTKTKGEGESDPFSPVDVEGSTQLGKPTSPVVQTPPAASPSATQSTSSVLDTAQAAKPAQPLSPADELEMRTVIAECLPQGYTKNDVDRDFCKYGPIESIELEEAQSTSGRGGLAYIIYKSLDAAQRAVCDLEMATKGGTAENDWRRQLIRVKSKKDYLVNKNVNTRYRRNSVTQGTQGTPHPNPQYGGHSGHTGHSGYSAHNTGHSGHSGHSTHGGGGGGGSHYYGPSYVSGESNRYRYPQASYQHQPQISDPLTAAILASLHAKQFEGTLPQSLEAMLKLSALSPLSPLPATSPVSPLDTPHSPFPTGGPQQYNQQRRKSEDHRRSQPRRTSISNVVTPGYVSLAQQASASAAPSSAAAASGHTANAGMTSPTTSPSPTTNPGNNNFHGSPTTGAGPSSPLQASATPFVRRNSLSENLQRNRLMSQHGILSIHSTTGVIQEDFRVVYPRGPDSSKGFVRAAGRGKPAKLR